MLTHEQFIAKVAEAAIEFASPKLDQNERGLLRNAKLVYGSSHGVRGITYYQRWRNGDQSAEPHAFVEVSAMGEESPTQLAGTTIHELAHVLAGHAAGHRKDWRTAAERLGLRLARAAGHNYLNAGFRPDLRFFIDSLGHPDDGQPVSLATLLPNVKFKPCQAAVGSMGGKSRGPGSGSRLRLFQCECMPPVKARVARDDFHALCTCCDSLFHRV